MHTYWVRLNAVFFYGLNVLLGLSCCAWVSCLQQDLDFHSDLPRPVVDTVRVNELLSLLSFMLPATFPPELALALLRLPLVPASSRASSSSTLPTSEPFTSR